MRFSLYEDEILALLFSLLLLFPLTKNFLYGIINPVFYPAFFLRNKFEEIIRLKAQRDELLREKSQVIVVFPTDTVNYYPVRFKSLCDFVSSSSEPYPSFIKIRCEGDVKEGDIVWAVGLVGFVISSRGKFAEVLTLHSPDFHSRVFIARSMVMGIIKGGNIPKIAFIPYGGDVKVGDTVYLMEHPGVEVGEVKEIKVNPPFISLDIKPFWRYEIWTRFSVLEPF
jgi:hypothetical protein